MDIFEQYIKLTEYGQWEKALPIIENIIELNPAIATSWFNYGVCLEALQRHKDAAEAFIKAYQINDEDYRAQYRAFRSFALAGDVIGFKKFLAEEVVEFPEVIELLDEDPIFKAMLSVPEVQEVIDKVVRD